MTSFSRSCLSAAALALFLAGAACTAGSTSAGVPAAQYGGTGDDGSGSAPTTVACDPLTSESISMPTPLLGIGKDTQGTLYVATGTDPGNGSPRVFVSAADGLDEQYVTGSGMSGGGGNADYSMSFVAPGQTAKNAARTLFVTTSGGNATAMSLANGETKGTSGDQPLTREPASTITSLMVRGLPLAPSFIGSLTDGTLLVVLRSTDTTRIFYGPADALAERKIISSTGDLADPVITFDVNGDPYVSTYHYLRNKSGEGGTNGFGDSSTWTLDTPSGTESVKISFDTSTLAGAKYQCIQ